MPRITKKRRVCVRPSVHRFAPGCRHRGNAVLGVDELEALRLCDLEGLDQDSAALRMGISRGTFQRILYQARKTTARALCEGLCLSIEGGSYAVAETPCSTPGRCSGCPFAQNRVRCLTDDGQSDD